jgi:hypothetical protein
MEKEDTAPADSEIGAGLFSTFIDSFFSHVGGFSVGIFSISD